MPRKITLQEFITKSNEVHNNKYNYSLVDYKNILSKVIILCSEHGEFLQRPNRHSHGDGCPLCGIQHRVLKRATSVEDFITKANMVHNNKYDYSLVEYKNNHTKITIVCPNHGEFKQLPNAHLSKKQGCPKCGGTQKSNTEEFIIKAKMVHSDRYKYPESDYIDAHTKIKIMCDTHGGFWQTPTHHLHNKAGCPECKREKLKEGKGGYTYEYFNNYPERKNNPTAFYIVEIVNGLDNFIKIGITTRTTGSRFSSGGYKKMNITVLQEYKMTLYDAFCLEQKTLAELKQYRFYPTLKFDGYTECLKKCSRVDEKLKEIYNKMLTSLKSDV